MTYSGFPASVGAKIIGRLLGTVAIPSTGYASVGTTYIYQAGNIRGGDTDPT